MGYKKIWDGNDLPGKGDEVLIHLSSYNQYIRHVVDSIKVDRSPGKSGENRDWRIQVNVLPSGDHRSAKNARLLEDVYPIDHCV